MVKHTWVISLGGSKIVPDDADLNFLQDFRRIILRYSKDSKFVIVCGGGSVARKYINALKSDKKSDYLQSLVGISVTRLNARFVSYLFGIDPEKGIPTDMKEVENILKKNDFVFCGGLRYAPDQTSDTTAARLASHLGAKFINITNVKGLYTADPKRDKSSKFIELITWKDFNSMVNKIKFSAGQHFVLDQSSAEEIMKHKTTTYVVGNLREFEKVLSNKPFVGTTISG
ncbi:MAG: UMP kinase [archaeon]